RRRGGGVREEEAESIACDFSVAGEKDDDSVLGVVGDSLTEPGKCCVEGVRGYLAASEDQIQSAAGRCVGAAGLMPAQEFRQAARVGLREAERIAAVVANSKREDVGPAGGFGGLAAYGDLGGSPIGRVTGGAAGHGVEAILASAESNLRGDRPVRSY